MRIKKIVKTREEYLAGWLKMGDVYIRRSIAGMPPWNRDALLRELPELAKFAPANDRETK